MTRILFLWLCVTPLFSSLLVLAGEQRPIEEVLAVGIQPGPQLWRVTKGDHELWVLGTLSPLPLGMQWDSQSVEAVLADSEEVIEPPGVGLSASPLKGIFSLPLLWGIRNNPGKEKLSEILPAELYERWSILKKRYIGTGKKIEKRRPMFAAYELYEKALDQSGLGNDRFVRKLIYKTIKKHKIPTTSTGLQGTLEDPRQAIKDFKRSTINDIDCFRLTIDRLEREIEAMSLRAHAWATGDIEALRLLLLSDQNNSCVQDVLASAFVADLMESTGLADSEKIMRDNWVQAAETALENNRVSFAFLPIEEILSPDGYISIIRRKGYTVRGG